MGSSVCLAIRPEDLTLTSAQAPPTIALNELAATVVHLVFMGDHYSCRMRLENGASFALYQPLATVLEIDDVVRLTIPPARVSVWPK